MSERRDAAWYLARDPDGFVRYAEGELDRLDVALDAEARVRFSETRSRLERLGFDVTRYREQPRLHASEFHASNWPTDEQMREYQHRQGDRYQRNSEKLLRHTHNGKVLGTR